MAVLVLEVEEAGIFSRLHPRITFCCLFSFHNTINNYDYVTLVTFMTQDTSDDRLPCPTER